MLNHKKSLGTVGMVNKVGPYMRQWARSTACGQRARALDEAERRLQHALHGADLAVVELREARRAEPRGHSHPQRLRLHLVPQQPATPAAPHT